MISAPTANTRQVMLLLGQRSIASVLGSYEDNLDTRDQLLAELLGDISPERSRERDGLFLAVQRRLWLYRLLAHEAAL